MIDNLRRRPRWLAIGLTAAWLLGGREAHGQTTGSIEGRIADSLGAPLPGVVVEATSASLQGVRTASAGRDGVYRIPALPPGDYRLEARREGFRAAEARVTVSLDATATVDFALQLETQERVAVSGESPLLDTTSAGTGTTYTSAVIARLPVDRNYADIVRANPGVSADLGQTQARGLALSIYGATSVENRWLIDGIDTTNVIKGSQGKTLNDEFIQEVEVKTGGYQAEYGRALGGVVNVITKSGGNQFHGGAFLYYDSAATRAEQVVTDRDSSTGMRISPARREDYGADLGGFLVKDRLWFFAAYDRIDAPGTASHTVSSPRVPSTLSFPRNQTDDLYSGKLTWSPDGRTTLVATAFSDPSEITGAARVGTTGGLISSPDPGTWESRREIGGSDFGLRLDRLLGAAAVLVLQAARHRNRFELFPSGAGLAVRFEDWTCTPAAPGGPCQPPPSPNFASGGLGIIGGPQQRNSSRRDQLGGGLTVYRGSHEIRIGGDYEDGRSTSITAYSGGQAVLRFNDRGVPYYRHDFLAASPADPTPSDSVVAVRTIDESAYLQDSWRAAPGLTVDAGLRWDQQDFRDDRGKTIFKTTAGWQPRLGVAWDPTGRGAMKVYASIGRFSYSLPTNVGVFSSPVVLVSTYNFDPLDMAQDASVPGHPAASVSLGGRNQVDPGVKGTYQDELTVGVERLLDPTLSAGIRATYRRLGRAIETRCDLEYPLPGVPATQCAILNPGSGETFAGGDVPVCNGLDAPYFQCTAAGPPTPEARRIYRGIEILARKSVADRLWIQASYVYSSLRGNYDGGVNEGSGETNPGTAADFDFPPFWSHNAYGPLFLDRPHRFRADASYTVPFGLFVGFGGYIQSGAPLDQLGYFNARYQPAIRLLPRGGAGRLPTLWEANVTLGYPIRIGPVTATIQTYVYNLFNNQLETQRDVSYTVRAPVGYPTSLYDSSVPSNNANYGRIVARQDPRLFRAAAKISF